MGIVADNTARNGQVAALLDRYRRSRTGIERAACQQEANRLAETLHEGTYRRGQVFMEVGPWGCAIRETTRPFFDLGEP